MLQSHLKKQTKIFWIHLLLAIGGAIVMIIVGTIMVAIMLASFILLSFYVVVLVAYVWIASFKGLSRLDAGAPID